MCLVLRSPECSLCPGGAQHLPRWDLRDNYGPHRNTEAFRLEKSPKNTRSNHHLTLPSPTTKACPSVPHPYLSETPQGQGLHRFPGHPLPMPELPLHEEVHPGIQPKPPWHNLMLFPYVPSLVTWEETGTPGQGKLALLWPQHEHWVSGWLQMHSFGDISQHCFCLGGLGGSSPWPET